LSKKKKKPQTFNNFGLLTYAFIIYFSIYIYIIKLKNILESATGNPTLLELRAITTETTKNASAIIVNTIHFLEQKTLTKVQEYFGIPIFPIGPFHKLAPSSSGSLLEEDTNCISWLDKQAP
jgi:hypothetical protein